MAPHFIAVAIALASLAISVSAAILASNPHQVSVELTTDRIHPLRGTAYAATLPPAAFAPFFTNNGDDYGIVRSGLRLYEDGTPLALPHASQSDVEQFGAGRYLHLRETELYFSTSDNSDPRTNGRTYRAVIEPVPAKGLWVPFLLLAAAALGYAASRSGRKPPTS